MNRSQVTRSDRAIQDEAWIASFLKHAQAGTIATCAEGQPYQSTLLFAYDPDQHAIYLHTGRRGRVWENVQMSSPCCFTAYAMGRLLPADTALNFSVEYQSVVAFGPLILIEDAAEAERGLQLLMDKYFPHLRPERDYRPITQGELMRTAVYRLEIEEWSGKRKAVAADFPGAFLYGEIIGT